MAEDKWHLEEIRVVELKKENRIDENTIYEDVKVAITYRKGIDVKIAHPPVLKGTFAKVGPDKFRFYLTWQSCVAVTEFISSTVKMDVNLGGRTIWLDINDAVEKWLIEKKPG